ncbi:MAG: alpha/beta fold hydrolase [Planctomycetaceae bacterium]|jgi:pimeloyl-ACP methyl ester carboxylesterase|nr:alpha/beta fold hydrolase [Planctomycetaceae bacterium]
MFGTSPWLPIRRGEPRQDAEDVEFTTQDGIVLKGSYFLCKDQNKQGIIVYCHELNGSRWGVSSHVDSLLRSGFDVFSFDMRNHGESRMTHEIVPTPWITKFDLEDVQAAVSYVLKRNYSDKNLKIGLLGVSKGATVAACVAGLDSRISSLVLDSPAPEGRLFERNCWISLLRVRHSWRTKFSKKYFFLLFKALLFSIAFPFILFFSEWWRWILGYWCGCRFVSTRVLVKFVQQPIFIIHGKNDTYCRVDQIHAFCRRMPHRPSVWLVSNSSHGQTAECAGDEYEKKVVGFFQKTMTHLSNHPSYSLDSVTKEKIPNFLRDLITSTP